MTQDSLDPVMKRNPNTFTHLQKPSNDSCESCGGPLTIITFKLFGEEIVLRPVCECRLKELEEQERLARIDKLHRLLRQQGLEDGLYGQMSLEGWECRDRSCQIVVDKLKNYLQTAHLGAKNWLYLFGGNGLGKTHLAVSVLKHLCLNRHWEPLMVRWSEYCSRIQQSWESGNNETEYDLWHRAKHVTLLVLDDVDKRAPSEWALGKLFELIDHRSLHLLPTILTANRSLQRLSTAWGRNEQMKDLAGAIVSRIVGQLSGLIEFSGRDCRFGNF